MNEITHNATQGEGDNNLPEEPRYANMKNNPDTPDIRFTSLSMSCDIQKSKSCKSKLTEAILAYVDQHEPVTFVELIRNLRSSFDVDGHESLVVCNLSHVVLWPEVNQVFIQAIKKLLNENKIHFAGGDENTYAMQGAIPNLPVCTPSDIYLGHNQWLPVFLRSGDESTTKLFESAEITAAAMRA